MCEALLGLCYDLSTNTQRLSVTTGEAFAWIKLTSACGSEGCDGFDTRAEHGNGLRLAVALPGVSLLALLALKYKY